MVLIFEYRVKLHSSVICTPRLKRLVRNWHCLRISYQVAASFTFSAVRNTPKHSETHRFLVAYQTVVKAMLHVIVTVIQHHDSGINSILVIHHILGKLNWVVRLARQILRNHQCDHRTKEFGDPWSRPLKRRSLVLLNARKWKCRPIVNLKKILRT